MQFSRCSLFAILGLSAASLAQQSALTTPPPPISIVAPPVRSVHSNTADLQVQLCPAKFDDSLATDRIAGRLEEEGVKPPTVMRYADAEFSDEARRQKRNGQELDFNVVIGLVVDSDGAPQDICVSRSEGYGLDARAAEAIRHYEFAPAKKGGKPVAARIHLEVDFHMD